MKETIKCLYCDSDNSSEDANCSHCGMALPECHPHSGTHRRRWFKWWFWPLVLFCLVMIVYLPR